MSNPLRNFWNATIGSVTVEIDQMIATQYLSVPDAAARIEAGQRGWNGQDLCATNVTFIGFGLRAFTETEKTSQPPNGKVYWVVKDPQNGSYAGIVSYFSNNRVVAARAMVHPGGTMDPTSDPLHLQSSRFTRNWTLI